MFFLLLSSVDWGNGDYEVIIKDSTNLEYVLTLIMQSYDKN